MRGYLTAGVVVMVAVAACTTSGTPATAPPATPATTTSVTTTMPPTTTTTTVATTTTADRVAEIEAIFQNLEERRLQALYDGDREAFRALFANPEYLTRSMGVFDMIEFVSPPEEVAVELIELVSDGSHCLAAVVYTDASAALGPEGSSERTVVIEAVGGDWGFSYVGEGWACDGPHPLSP